MHFLDRLRSHRRELAQVGEGQLGKLLRDLFITNALVHALMRKARRAFLIAIATKNNTVAKSTIVAPLEART
jgi:hypothetical protein